MTFVIIVCASAYSIPTCQFKAVPVSYLRFNGSFHFIYHYMACIDFVSPAEIIQASFSLTKFMLVGKNLFQKLGNCCIYIGKERRIITSVLSFHLCQGN